MNIFTLQLDITWENRPANHQKVAELLNGQNIVKNSLIVLPEMFDVGFSMNTEATAPTSENNSEIFVKSIATTYQSCVVAGIVNHRKKQQLVNEAIVVTPSGDTLCQYHKMQPFTPLDEHKHYHAGDKHQQFHWQDFKISPFICYDLRFPEIFRPAAQQGTELFIVVANWPNTRTEHWLSLLKARAIENQVFVLGVNRCGQDPALGYDGASCLFDPLGRNIFTLDHNEQIHQTSINKQDITNWREQFPALKDIRFF